MFGWKWDKIGVKFPVKSYLKFNQIVNFVMALAVQCNNLGSWCCNDCYLYVVHTSLHLQTSDEQSADGSTEKHSRGQ